MNEEKKVLRHIVKGIYNIDTNDYELFDKILDNYTDKVYVGQFKNEGKHIIGEYNGMVVSIEKNGLLELYSIINELLN